MSRRSDSVHSIHPLNLLSPSRLDLVCKYLYFRQLLTSADANDADGTPAAQMYEKHIAQRTGGLEPQDPFQADPSTIEKLSVADYVRHAGLLLASMKERGFDAGGAVTYCPNGTLGNGAHRISAALALDIPIFARFHEGPGTDWGFNWFVQNGFTTGELQTLLYGYTRLKAADVAVFVSYGPVRKHWDAFTQTISRSLYLVGELDISLDSDLSMYELIHDVYASLEPRGSSGVINRKALLLAMARPLAVRIVVAERKNAGDDVHRIASDIKATCREMAAETVAPSTYLAVHASSSLEETLNLAGVLLSPNSLRQLARRPSPAGRSEFLQWLGECRQTCLAAGIALDDICVVGSSPLEVVGVRPSTDIDFTLKSRYRRERYGMGVSHLTPVVDIVTAGYHRSRQGAAIPDDELIDSPDFHFMFRGIKFANPEIVLDQKDFYRRDKDVRDVQAAGAAFAAPRTASFDPAFEFASCTEVLIRELTGQAPATSMRSPKGRLLRVSSRMYRVGAKLAARARRRLSALARSPHAR